jgi:SpoVK/Ycf46/Vps4 family AAA+-type ATPase
MSSANDPRNQLPRLDNLAQKMEPNANQPEIALPETQLQMLRQIAARASERAPIALFVGTDSAAKAAAATVLARELHRNVHRIDLAAIVSKYIGETEKNLRRVFDAAEASGALLFFDEAEALFSNRSEVKDAHDRYANIEVNYLLQHIEEYHAIAIIAINMITSWHADWLHRVHFVLHFPPIPPK